MATTTDNTFRYGDRVTITTEKSVHKGHRGTITDPCGHPFLDGLWVQLDNGVKLPFDPREMERVSETMEKERAKKFKGVKLQVMARPEITEAQKERAKRNVYILADVKDGEALADILRGPEIKHSDCDFAYELVRRWNAFEEK